jgi:hypothetical protein
MIPFTSAVHIAEVCRFAAFIDFELLEWDVLKPKIQAKFTNLDYFSNIMT